MNSHRPRGEGECVHRQRAWPHGLSDQLEDILEGTVVHQQREHAVVFPMLMTGWTPAGQTVGEMIAAHETCSGAGAGSTSEPEA